MRRPPLAAICAVFGFIAKFVMVMTQAAGFDLRRIFGAEAVVVVVVVEGAGVGVVAISGRTAALRTVGVVEGLFLSLSRANDVDVRFIRLEGGSVGSRRSVGVEGSVGDPPTNGVDAGCSRSSVERMTVFVVEAVGQLSELGGRHRLCFLS